MGSGVMCLILCEVCVTKVHTHLSKFVYWFMQFMDVNFILNVFTFTFNLSLKSCKQILNPSEGYLG